MNLLVKLGVYGIILMGLAIIYHAISGIRTGADSGNWPVVEGTIVKSEVVSRSSYSGNKWQYEKFSDILYRYEVNGKTYTNFKISFGSGYTDKGDGLARQFPLEKKVRVFYDPTDPETSVLIPGGMSAGQIFGMLLMGIIFTGLGIFGVRQLKQNA